MSPIAVSAVGLALPSPNEGGAVPRERYYDPNSDGQIPARMRRRLTRLTAMAIKATRECTEGRHVGHHTPLVFATANGEVNVIGSILQTLCGPEVEISPAAFHRSVHNTAPGYYTILTGRKSPTTTLSMGSLSFEYAMLETWARLHAGEKQVQVTAGDEGIEGLTWADPAHCSHDFCGSWLLEVHAEEHVGDGNRPVAFIDSVQHAVLDDDHQLEVFRRDLVKRHAPSVVVMDDKLVVGDGDKSALLLPDGATNPCSGLYTAIRFVQTPSLSGTLLLVKRGPGRDCVATVVRKNEQ